MDAKSILDSLFASGKQLTDKAVSFAEDNLGLPKPGKDRDDMVKTLGAGAAVGGIAAMLFGTKTGRKISGKLLAVGSLAAVGGVAYTAYQSWMKSQGKSPESQNDVSVTTLTGVAAERRSLTILRAMIAAAKADGVIDAEEQSLLNQQLERSDLADDAKQWFRAEMSKRHDVSSIAAEVDSPAAAAEVYLVSSIVVDDASPIERAYLDQLKDALKIDEGLVDQLKLQMRGAV
jgi:uncharacterized membrane protein YebE (DUF533 family)